MLCLVTDGDGVEGEGGGGEDYPDVSASTPRAGNGVSTIDGTLRPRLGGASADELSTADGVPGPDGSGGENVRRAGRNGGEGGFFAGTEV